MSPQSGSVLVVTDRRFWHRSLGSEQRVASLVEHLAGRGEGVTVAYLGRVSGTERRALADFGEALPGFAVRTRRAGLGATLAAGLSAIAAGLRSTRLRSVGRRRSTGAVNPFLREGSAGRRRFVDALVGELAPRAVIVEFLRLTPTVHPRPTPGSGTIPYLVDTHDLLHRRAARFRAGGAAAVPAVEARDEAHALTTFDVILAIQDEEARAIAALVPGRPVLVVPHGLALPMPIPGFVPGPRPIRLGLLGGPDESNHAGLRWFLEHVWGKLVARFGVGIELWLAGRICESWTRAEKGMRIRGSVESIADFWPEIDIAINPIRFGSGLKIKNVEALAYGRALVTTPVGAEGLEGAAPEGMAIADTPEEWLALLGRWLEDPARRSEVGRQGRAHAERHFSPTAAFRELDVFLDGLARTAPRGPSTP